MSFVADDLTAWLVALLADAGRKKLTSLFLGDEQERALRQAATAAIWLVARDMRPESDKRAEELAMVVSQVFGEPVPDMSSLSVRATLLEALQAGIARQLAVLDDASLTGTGQSSAQVLGLSFTTLAEKLISHLVREIVIRGSRGGPLEPLAGQLNHDMTHLQGRRLEDMVGQLTHEVREAIVRQDGGDLKVPSFTPDIGAAWTDDGLWRQAGTSAEALSLGYIDQIRDLAPKQLLDREGELADLMSFCAGEEPYAWWQAGPWAGKSALAAWLVLHPPTGVTVASFFITSRWAGQADSDAYTTELIQQLAAISGMPEPSASTPAAREKARRYLLTTAIERCEKRGERLLLVIDGLDEDQASRSGNTKLPSIASLLPLHPPAALRVLVTSRLHPGLPSDVPLHHPLRACMPHTLTPSPHARELADLAKEELRQRCASVDSRVVNILGYLVASGGGLTRAELAHLTGIPGWMLQELFFSSFGRTLQARTARDMEHVFLFAHETLDEEASRFFSDDLPDYRRQIHLWADGYRTQGWPADTPRYLLAPYSSLLSVIGDVSRLVMLAVDPARHDRMLTREHNDDAALTEVLAARRALEADLPDLVTLSKLAISEWRLRTRNSAIPVGLPVIWARLGETERAVLAARTITDPRNRDQALSGVVENVASRDLGRAEDAARMIEDPITQAYALADVAVKIAFADPNRAKQAAKAITMSSAQAYALRQITAIEADTDPVRAERTARTISDGGQARALAAIVAAVARTDPQRASRLAAEAERAARTETGLDRSFALADVAVALTAINPRRAEQIARTIDWSSQQDWALNRIAISIAAINPSRAERIAQEITEPDLQVHALARIAAAVVATDRSHAERLIEDIKAHADSTAEDDSEDGSDSYSWALLEITKALAAAEPCLAEEIARDISEPDWQARGLASIAAAVSVSSSDSSHRLAVDAEEIARTIINPESQALALTYIASALSKNDPERARRLATDVERIVRAIRSPTHDRALRSVATVLAPVDPSRAEQVADAIADSEEQAEALADIAIAIAATDFHRAERLADLITNRNIHAKAMAGLAAAAAATDLDYAERIVRAINDPYRHACALAGIVAGAIRNNDRVRVLLLAIDAEQLACSVTSPNRRAQALAQIATAVEAISPERGRRLALDAEQTAHAIVDSSSRRRALADIAAVLARSYPGRAHRLALDAEKLARKIANPSDQVKALVGIVTALAVTDPNHARRVLSNIISVEHVFEVLPALVRLEADATPEICELALLCFDIQHPDTSAN